MRGAGAVAALAFLFTWTAGCLAPDAGSQDAMTDPELGPQPVRFVAIGDMGTGEEPQFRVAAAMQTVCQDLGCDFVIGMGDNIYEAGATSPYDPQFVLKFEQPYAAFDIPFYMTLGNHDNGGVNGIHPVGDMQVLYGAREDRAMDLWRMPDRYYAHDHGPVRFLALDTTVVQGAGDLLLTDDPGGERQIAWFAQEMEAANATGPAWTFAHGHHPLFSNGEHGDAHVESDLRESFLRETVCGQVDVFFAGHDHDLQWIKAKPDECGTTEFIVSGAAAKTRPLPRDNNEAWFGQGDTNGFVWVEVDGDTFTARFFDDAATLLYERAFQHEG